MSQITRILNSIDRGEIKASAELVPLVYDELRKLATLKMAQEHVGQTLQPTALVHEAYLRLIGSGGSPQWDSRRHFFAAAAEAMRRILVDNARRKARIKHGQGIRLQSLPEDLASPQCDNDVPAIDSALAKLAEQHPLKSRLVELRFFGGLTGEQAAEVLGISPSSADRQWVFARAWLRRELGVGRSKGKS